MHIKHRYSGLVADFNNQPSISTRGDWRVDGEMGITVNAHHPEHPQGFVTILACPGGSDRTSLAELQANARLIARAPRLEVAARGAIAALTQNATHPADIDAAVSFLLDAVKDL